MKLNSSINFKNKKEIIECHPFENYINKFSKIMPKIIFDKNEKLIDTFQKYYDIIGKHSHAYSKASIPYYLSLLLENYDKLSTNVNFVLDTTFRHQGSIYTQTYYIIIFIIEILNRENDIMSKKESKLSLEQQLYYEYYVIEPLLHYYNIDLMPQYLYNIKESNLFNEFTNLDTQKRIITEKIIKMVEEYLINIKDILIDKCIKEEITPIRVLWLYASPLTYNEIEKILKNTNNKYIRDSIYWIAGFQEIKEVKKLINSNNEYTSFIIGYDLKKRYKYRKKNKEYEKKKYKLYDVKKFKKYIFSRNQNYCCKLENLKKFNGKCENCEKIINNEEYDKDSINELKENYKNRIEFFNKINKKLNNEELNNILSENKYSNIFFYSKTIQFTYYPFYNFSNHYNNWSIYIYNEKFNNELKNIANEYKDYYKNKQKIPNYYLDKNEDKELIFINNYFLKIEN